MKDNEQSVWEATFDDIKGSPWSEIVCCALGMIGLLAVNILIIFGIVDFTYGTIATEGEGQLTFIVTLGYEAIILIMSGLVFLKRPMIALVVFIALCFATWVTVPITVGRIAPETTACDRINSVVEARDYRVSVPEVGYVCLQYVREHRPLEF